MSSSSSNVEAWKLKRLIKGLEAVRGNGTSMISLIIPPGDQISRVSGMLTQEYGTASNIKSRVNRLSVLDAITSVQNRLKLWASVPKNGLVIYCGTILTEANGEKKVTIDFEPLKPVNTSLYLCDKQFHTEALKDLFVEDNMFGVIVIDGKGIYIGTICGNTRTKLYEEKVELPNKHGRGGQSALRFSRLREEKIHNYMHKCAEAATKYFITNDRPNVVGLIVAGSANLKTRLCDGGLFDPRLQSSILKFVDVSYGGERGFHEAIHQSTEVLVNVRFVREAALLRKYFDNIALDNNLVCFGIESTLRALEAGAVETLIVWDNLEMTRYVLKDGSVKHAKQFVSDEIVSSSPFCEWIAENYTNFGTTLEIISDSTQEGTQFCRGFGGFGGILRYVFDTVDEDDFEAIPDVNIDDYL